MYNDGGSHTAEDSTTSVTKIARKKIVADDLADRSSPNRTRFFPSVPAQRNRVSCFAYRSGRAKSLGVHLIMDVPHTRARLLRETGACACEKGTFALFR